MVDCTHRRAAKWGFLVLFVLSSVSISAQSKSIGLSDTIHVTLGQDSMCVVQTFTKQQAIRDIQTESMKLVLLAGFTGFGQVDSCALYEFEIKYGVQIVFMGCMRIGISSNSNIEEYNVEILRYLTSKHGAEVLVAFGALRN